LEKSESFGLIQPEQWPGVFKSVLALFGGFDPPVTRERFYICHDVFTG
jgi:hypothetical protein